MYHSIYIGEKNTWDDFHLIGSSRPVIDPPDVDTMYIDVHGVDGQLDLSTALTGHVMYKNREGSWEFTVANWYESWEVIYHKLLNYLHGRRFVIMLEDDAGFYYEGRLSVNQWKSSNLNSTVTIDYTLDPYKYEIGSDWLWDPFNFEIGVARDNLLNITVDGSATVTIYGSQRPNVLKVHSSTNGLTVCIPNGPVYTLSEGDNYIPEIVLYEDATDLLFQGTGVVSISYKGGWL